MENTIKQRLEMLNPQYRSFVESSDFDQIITVLGEAENLSPDQLDGLGDALFLYLIFLLNREQCERFIIQDSGLPLLTVKTLVSGFILALPPSIRRAYDQAAEELGLNKSVDNDLVSEIYETEKLLATIPGIRTMSSDQTQSLKYPDQSEPVYTSTQAAILGETRTPTPIPAPPRSANPLQPRWDTD